MQTYKHPFIYDAINAGIYDFKTKRGYDPKDKIAAALGYGKKNRSQQLRNLLNPNTQLLLKLDHFIIILDNLLDSKSIPLRTLANHYGYSLIKRGEAPKEQIVNLVIKTNLKLEVELGEFAKEVMQALEDGEIDYDEAARLRKKIKKFREILDRLDARLMEMVERL